MSRKLKVSIISSQCQLLNTLIVDHVDSVRSHTVFYLDKKTKKNFRIFEEVQASDIYDGIVRLHFKTCHAEITRI
jgi:hypothetical protein